MPWENARGYSETRAKRIAVIEVGEHIVLAEPVRKMSRKLSRSGFDSRIDHPAAEEIVRESQVSKMSRKLSRSGFNVCIDCRAAESTASASDSKMLSERSVPVCLLMVYCAYHTQMASVWLHGEEFGTINEPEFGMDSIKACLHV
ncbi:hypothetical protein Q7P35_009456 [Cladosporium inversicolor]